VNYRDIGFDDGYPPEWDLPDEEEEEDTDELYRRFKECIHR